MTTGKYLMTISFLGQSCPTCLPTVSTIVPERSLIVPKRLKFFQFDVLSNGKERGRGMPVLSSILSGPLMAAVQTAQKIWMKSILDL